MTFLRQLLIKISVVYHGGKWWWGNFQLELCYRTNWAMTQLFFGLLTSNGTFRNGCCFFANTVLDELVILWNISAAVTLLIHLNKDTMQLSSIRHWIDPLSYIAFEVINCTLLKPNSYRPWAPRTTFEQNTIIHQTNFGIGINTFSLME